MDRMENLDNFDNGLDDVEENKKEMAALKANEEKCWLDGSCADKVPLYNTLEYRVGILFKEGHRKQVERAFLNL